MSLYIYNLVLTGADLRRAVKNPLHTRAGALRIFGELAKLSVNKRLHYNRVADFNHDPATPLCLGVSGEVQVINMPVLKSPDHPLENRRLPYAGTELDRAITEEALNCGMMVTPGTLYAVVHRGYLAVYADLESASMAWCAGECIRGAEVMAGIETHFTVAAAIGATGEEYDGVSEMQRPAGH